MSQETRAQIAQSRTSRSTPETHSPAHILAVALSLRALDGMPRHVRAPDAHVSQTTLADLPFDAMTGPDAPDLIICPLTATGFDAMDLLARLRDAGFRGRFLVLAPHMPDIALIRAEMLSSAGDVNVDIIALDGESVLHLL